MSWSCQLEKGCVPTEAIRRFALPASDASLLRNSTTCSRAFEIEEQISVPSSTTDWCISGLICSFKRTLPPSRISWICERSSRVSGSTIANSSSIPSVKVWFVAGIGWQLLSLKNSALSCEATEQDEARMTNDELMSKLE